MSIKIEIFPNGYNEHGYHVVVYKQFKWLPIKFEIGRVSTLTQLIDFFNVYSDFSGKECADVMEMLRNEREIS